MAPWDSPVFPKAIPQVLQVLLKCSPCAPGFFAHEALLNVHNASRYTCKQRSGDVTVTHVKPGVLHR